MNKREILHSLKLAHENLMKRQYNNSRMQIGIMIRILEKEYELAKVKKH